MATNRRQDERHLAWLRLRTDGISCRKIAKMWGMTDAAVVDATNKPFLADLAESGEPESEVRKGYWS